LITNYLLKEINNWFSWLDDLEKLFNEYKSISKGNMWFAENWKNTFQ
jgi:inorganic pyrophosphatase